MKKIASVFTIPLIIGFVSCTTSRAVVSSSANLAEYNYATITDVMEYGGSAVLMDLEVKIYDALSSTRLQVIGDGQIDQLSDAQKQQLLIVRFSASQNEESVVSINFVDYITGRPIASCRGANIMGLTTNRNTKVAIDKAFEQMRKIF